ncbi:DNA-binding response regulator [Prauserella marina]|uniref:DNA-binding response regulator, NarL/FixJ family, contains REC and HTH domains n=1 Tax=Prauserella marina TaxID=530584 RepID=A0A222VKT8_9PSEU|nr:response regulator transcription factor [Prauserella marina]ASR34535.1 DNA-binding response regulator [Prauserella marina]PWV85857.1 LuxR family two component transcriptional regulator [Prauserella marina]SDC43791.1 DNA-binding response regulator, NarL/FixJ family, contains REC and HTH domains [Prauserella marina]
MTPLRLVVIDDHPVVRDGLRAMLGTQADFEIVGEAASGQEALAVVAATVPDVALTDLRMPDPSGAELIRLLLETTPAVKVLVLTTHDTDSDVLPAVEAGAIGYLLKDAPREELFRAVRAAARGETVLSSSVAALLLRRVRPAHRLAATPLSAREREVLALVARGNTNRETAAMLHLSEATVKTHLLHIYAKLEVPDRASAVASAYRLGILGGESG